LCSNNYSHNSFMKINLIWHIPCFKSFSTYYCLGSSTRG
jgi:hypothetical protein